jgi:hypothetical protein
MVWDGCPFTCDGIPPDFVAALRPPVKLKTQHFQSFRDLTIRVARESSHHYILYGKKYVHTAFIAFSHFHGFYWILLINLLTRQLLV